MTERRIEYVSIQKLVGAKKNTKLHADSEIAESMDVFGYTEPVLLDERTKRLVAGHGRLKAIKSLRKEGGQPPDGVKVDAGGEWLIPVVRGWASRDDAHAEAYLLASNQLTALGGYDNPQLLEMLKALEEAQALAGTGFGSKDIEQLLIQLKKETKEGLTDPDDVPEVLGPSTVKPGELWVLGGHRIICGSCTDAATVDRLMRGEQARMCWTDPPWNVAYGESTNPAGKKHTPIANDNLGAKFPAFCEEFCEQIARVLVPGSPLYMAMSAQEWPTIHGALVDMKFHWSSTIIWTKDTLVLSRKDYHTQYEPIWYGWLGPEPRLVQLEDRTQSDVWPIPRPKKNDEHPTMKPVELVVRSLKNSSVRNDLVFEPFSGSGTTLIACEETGRRCRAVELEPRYVQVAIERWQKFTGKQAVREESAPTVQTLEG